MDSCRLGDKHYLVEIAQLLSVDMKELITDEKERND